MPQFNPYAAEEATIETAVPEYSMPRGTFAAPSLEDGDAYNDEFGWGPRLRTSSVGTPSAQRLGVIPRFDDRPNPGRPPQEFYEQRNGRDLLARHSVESQDADGWQESKGILPGVPRWAPNPRSVPVPESRITQQMSPANYAFTRPYDQLNRDYDGVLVGSARHFNGTHFSMADNKRDYEAVGSMPVRTGRNTYRMEPQPWDIGIVDKPTGGQVPEQIIREYQLPPRGRSYRLG